MNSFKLTKMALRDLRNIAKYTENRWNRSQRDIYIKQFDDTFHKLSENPEIGIPSDFVRQDYLKFPQGSHLIFYKIMRKNNIKIIRILHKKMDVASKP